MKRTVIFVTALALTTTLACAGKQKTEETTATPAAVSTPTCGNYVIMVEEAVVATEDYKKDVIQRAFLKGLQDAGCPGLTTAPASTPEGSSLLRVTLKATATGDGTGKLSATVTDQATSEVKWRMQESITGDGSAAAQTMAGKVATKVQGS